MGAGTRVTRLVIVATVAKILVAFVLATVFATAVFATAVFGLVLVIVLVFHKKYSFYKATTLKERVISFLQKASAIPRSLVLLCKAGKLSTLLPLRAYNRIRYKSKVTGVRFYTAYRFSRYRKDIGK